jgi:para-aminobenzoate synthetase component 1
LYLDLRNLNPAPFSAYLDFGEGQIISASPERLVNLYGGRIETRPIKGTRKRTRCPEADLELRQDLISSSKDRSENVMIVDLMRNDLSRVAVPDSVVVRKLCGVEQFQNVLHLVSVVEGRLQDDYDGIDLLKAVFPGGSITGAPKIRAMEIIAELEPTVRGPYCGSLGYMGWDGNLDFNILIRTITASGGWWQIPAGGGIVSDSVPELEYQETWTKAVGMSIVSSITWSVTFGSWLATMCWWFETTAISWTRCNPVILRPC